MVQSNQTNKQTRNKQTKRHAGENPTRKNPTRKNQSITKKSVRDNIHANNMRVSKNIFGPLNTALEAHLEGILPLAAAAAEHAGRKTVQSRDLELVKAIQRK